MHLVGVHGYTGARCEEDAAAEGRPIVFLRGLDGARSSFAMRDLFDAFRMERPAAAIDLHAVRRHGRGVRAFREALVLIVDSILEDVVGRYGSAPDVVAAGLSGEIAAYACQRASRLVRSLSLIAPTGFARSWTARLLLPFGSLSDPEIAQTTYDVIGVPLLLVHGDGPERERRAIADFVRRNARVERATVRSGCEAPHVVRAHETTDCLRAFWGVLPNRVQLRVIRGGVQKASDCALRSRVRRAKASRRVPLPGAEK